jgi:hypothetical protein
MPGPAPKEHTRRRNARPGVTYLPREGFSGPLPSWPLSRQNQGEASAWASLWQLPQAAAWDELRLHRTVARYVRALVKAERPGAVAFLLSEVRQLEDRLGLTPMSMLRLRWEMAPAPTSQEGTAENVSSLDDRRQRLAGGA